MAALKPVRLVAGDCWHRAWRLQQSGGAPVDLTGASARLHVRDAEGAKVAEASTADGRIVITPAQGRIEMTIPAAATPLPVGSYRYWASLIASAAATLRALAIASHDTALGRVVNGAPVCSYLYAAGSGSTLPATAPTSLSNGTGPVPAIYLIE